MVCLSGDKSLLSNNTLKSLLVHQRQIVRLCFQQTNCERSTSYNFRLFGVLPVYLEFNKIAVLWMVQILYIYIWIWTDENKINNKIVSRAFDAIIL